MTERRPRKESNIVLLAIINDEVRLPVGETVAILHRHNGHDLAGPLNVFARYVRERDMTNLPLLAQLGQCFYRSLEGDGVIGSMKLMNIDTVQAQSLQTPLERFGEMFRAGVVRPLAGARALPSTLGCDH